MSVSRHRLWAVAMVLLALCVAGSAVHASRAAAADFTWSSSSWTTDTWLKGIDINPTVLVDGSDTWMIASRGTIPQVPLRWKGSDIDHLTAQPNGVYDGSFTQPHGDDRYWIGGVWRDPSDGTWYGLVHREYNYNDPFRYPWTQRKIGLATSTDKGANWHFEGDVITPSTSRPKPDPSYTDMGAGDQKLVVDTAGGYFYLYYFTAWWTTANRVVHDPYMGVARCPIASKMAPGCWQKWYRGGWTEAGLGGLDSEAIPGGTVLMSVHYNTYLGKWLYLDGNDIRTATSLAIQNWTNTDQTWPGDTVRDYNWVVDSTGTTSATAGQTFRVYNAYAGQNGRHQTVTLGAGTTLPANHLSNPGFESGTAGWTNHGTGTKTIVTSGAHGGSNALQQTGYGGFTQEYTDYYGGWGGGTIWHVGPVAKLHVSGWMKATSGSIGWIGVKYTLDGTDYYSLAPVTSTAWTYVERQVAVPAHASKVWAIGWVEYAGDTVTFDDLSLEPATVNLVKNPSYEHGFADWGAWGVTGSLEDDTGDNAFTGAVAAKMDNYGRGQTVTGWTAGQQYSVGAWGKVAAAGDLGAVGVKLIDGSGNATYESTVFTDTSWKYQYVDVTIPVGTVRVDVFTYVNPGQGAFYVDGVSMSQ